MEGGGRRKAEWRKGAVPHNSKNKKAKVNTFNSTGVGFICVEYGVRNKVRIGRLHVSNQATSTSALPSK